MVAVLNFMPFIGPLVCNVVVFVVGFASFNSIAEAIYPVVALAMLNLVEGQLITPTIVGRRSRVGPLSVFLGLAFGAWLWGVMGALVAAPLLIVGHRFWQRVILPELASAMRPHVPSTVPSAAGAAVLAGGENEGRRACG